MGGSTEGVSGEDEGGCFLAALFFPGFDLIGLFEHFFCVERRKEKSRRKKDCSKGKTILEIFENYMNYVIILRLLFDFASSPLFLSVSLG